MRSLLDFAACAYPPPPKLIGLDRAYLLHKILWKIPQLAKSHRAGKPAMVATGPRPSRCREDREEPMKTNYKLAIALIAGTAIGGTAIQGLHAQAKPPAYVIIPILKINDADTYKTGVIDKASATAGEMAAAGGHFIIRSQKFTSLDGDPPVRLVVIAFDSVEKAQAFENTAAQKEINAARIKSTNSLSFIVEGIAN
jgi:uncharacterized protein (DUF1330 family)